MHSIGGEASHYYHTNQNEEGKSREAKREEEQGKAKKNRFARGAQTSLTAVMTATISRQKRLVGADRDVTQSLNRNHTPTID